MKYLSKRNLLGAMLFLIMVGEPTVGAASGLYTPPGFIVLGTLYILLFLLYESLTVRYGLSYGRLALLNFGVYSIGITGLLHGELANYALTPRDNFITTLIRVQASFFPLFAYYLVNRYIVRKPANIPRLRTILIACGIYVALLSLSHTFGIDMVLKVLHHAPLYFLVGIGMAMWAVVAALRPGIVIKQPFRDAYLGPISIGLLILGCIPLLPAFVTLLITMPVAAIYYLSKPTFRNTTI